VQKVNANASTKYSSFDAFKLIMLKMNKIHYSRVSCFRLRDETARNLFRKYNTRANLSNISWTGVA